MNNKVITAIAVLALGLVMFWPAGSSKKVESLYKEGEALYTKKIMKVRLANTRMH